MLLASENPLEFVIDKAWPCGWFSSQIAVMVLVGLVLMVTLPLIVRRQKGLVPRGAYRLAEAFVLLVRDRIAAPAMGPLATAFTPFLCTLMAFLLLVNLFGLIPLGELFKMIGLENYPVGGAATGSIYVTGALACMTLVMIVGTSFTTVVRRLAWPAKAAHADHSHDHGSADAGHDAGHHTVPAGANIFLAAANAIEARHWPVALALPLAVVVWLNSFVPPLPGAMGLVLWPMLLALELLGYVIRCFALAIRLFANMVSGHILLGVLIIMAAACTGWALLAAIPLGLGTVAIMMLEVLVALLHAYIFTFLSALFIGMAANPQH